MSIAGIACAPEPLVFPDWTIPLPEGTPVREYAAVPALERTEVVRFERDLVISEGMGRGLYRPSQVVTTRDGRVLVLDNGNVRVVVFDREGKPLVELGSSGQGPGELQSPTGFGVAGDDVVISDFRNSRLTIYRLSGELVADHRLEQPLWVRQVAGTSDEPVMLVAPPIAMSFGGRPQQPFPWLIGRYTPQGEQVAPLIELTAINQAIVDGDEVVGRLPVPVGNPIGVLLADGSAYVTTAGEYQVVALAPTGTFSWALRTDWAPEPLTEARRQQLLEDYESLAIRQPNPRFTWPERYAAIENLEADGDANLWVFPYAYRRRGVDPSPDNPVPVDVYSPEGEPLFSGLSPIGSWEAAHDRHVYRIEDDPETGEQVVVRYRIPTSF